MINVSATGDRVEFLDANDREHFLRIPIHDSLTSQLLPYFEQAFAFIGECNDNEVTYVYVSAPFLERARLKNGHVLIHCLGS